MAEVVGVVSGAAGLTSLSIQVIQGIHKFVEFCGNVQDAPLHLLRLLSELESFRLILNDTTKRVTDLAELGCSEPSYPFVLRDTQHQLQELLDMARQHSHKDTYGKAPGFWKQASFVLKRDKFRQHVESLERSKFALQQAQRNMDRLLQQRQYLQLQLLDQSHARLAREHNSSASLVVATHEKVKKVADDLEIMRSESSINAGQTSDRIALAHDRVEEIKNEIREVKDVVRRVVKKLDAPALPFLMSNQIETTIQDAIAMHLTKRDSGVEMVTSERDSRSLRAPLRPRDPALVDISDASETFPQKPSDGSMANTGQRKTRTFTRRSSFFGTILIRTTSRTTYRTSSGGQEDSLREESHLDITLLPARWLLNRGVAAGLRQIAIERGQPSISVHIEPFRIINDEASIIRACFEGNLREVRRLFQSGAASPFDRTSSGQTLLHLVVYDRKFLALPCHQRVKDLLAERRALEIAECLVHAGVDPGAQDQFGRTPLQLLLFTFAHNRFKLGEKQEPVDALVRFMIQKSKKDPFATDRHGENEISELCAYPDVFERHRQLSRFMLLGQTNWCIDYNESIRVAEPVAGSLVRLHVANDPNSEMALQQRTTDLRIWLQTKQNFDGVPLKHYALLAEAFKQGGAALRKDPRLKRFIQEAVYRNVVNIIEAGIDIHRCDTFGQTPTNEARKADLLGVWRSALQRCRENPDTVIETQDQVTLSRLRWEENEIDRYLREKEDPLREAFRRSGKAIGPDDAFNKLVEEALERTLVHMICKGADTDYLRPPTVIDVAWRRCLLHVWRAALIECGYDADAFIEANEDTAIGRIYWSEDEVQRRLNVESLGAINAIERAAAILGLNEYPIHYRKASMNWLDVPQYNVGRDETLSVYESLQRELVEILTRGEDLRLTRRTMYQSATEAAHWYGLIPVWRAALSACGHDMRTIISFHDKVFLEGLRWTDRKTQWQIEKGESVLPAAIFQAGRCLGADDSFNEKDQRGPSREPPSESQAWCQFTTARHTRLDCGRVGEAL